MNYFKKFEELYFIPGFTYYSDSFFENPLIVINKVEIILINYMDIIDLGLDITAQIRLFRKNKNAIQLK